MPATLFPRPKNDVEERDERVDLLFHNVFSFLEKGKGLPDLAVLSKPAKTSDFVIKATEKGLKANRNKRKMLYTLSGPAFAYAGAGVAGLLLGATNPFGWAALGAAATGWAIGKCTKKAWRAFRANLIALPHMKALETAVAGQKNTKVTWDNVNQSRFWIQKKKLSAISDTGKLIFEAAQVFNKPIKPTSCYDVCKFAAGYYRMAELSGKLAKDATEFLAFDLWVKRILHILDEQYTPEKISQAFHRICLQTWGARHSCSGTCYEKLGATSLKNPEKSATLGMFRAPNLYYNPFGRVLLDAMNRVDSGSMTSKINYKYDLYKKVIDFAQFAKLYDSSVGGKLDIPVMALTGYPDQPAITHPVAAALWKAAESDGKVKKGAVAPFMSGGFGSAGAAAKAAVAKELGKKSFDQLGDGAYDAATNIVISYGMVGGGAGGAILDKIFQGVIDWANKSLEVKALQKELDKELSKRDLGKMLTSLRTLLKDEGKFEVFGEQFAKVTVWLDKYLTLMRQDKLKNCQEAYDLAVAIFEIKKHFEKASESLVLLTLFSDIVDTMCLITHPDYLEIIEDTVAKAAGDWLSAHPRKMCKGVCYHPTESELVEMVDGSGTVVGVESFVLPA